MNEINYSYFHLEFIYEIVNIFICTIMKKNSAPFPLGGDNLKWYFDQR